MSKRSGFFLGVLLFVCSAGFTQQQQKLYLSSFGAKANDNKSDHIAFNKAAAFINSNKGNVHLIISAGEYTVGVKPRANTGYSGKASLNDVMQLVNCSNITIEGTGKVVIKFEKALPFGKVLQPQKDKDSSVHIGSLFRFISCDNIRILNILADGNKDNFLLLKKWGDGPAAYEREHEGLFIINCRKVVVKNTSFNNFGRDGMQIQQDPENRPVEDLEFINCRFNGNGRDGVSWCGGNNVRFYNCSFNDNGRGKIITNPASGVDIEPERKALCSNGSFIKCSFVNNAGYAVVSGLAEASDIVFDSCTITGNTNYALFCNSPRFTFKNTRIYGTVLVSYDAGTEKEGMRFFNCTFSDSVVKTKIFSTNYLVAVTGRYANFENCIFAVQKKPVLYTEIKKKKSLKDTENTGFKNCVFSVYFKKASTWGEYALLVSHSNFNNCTFKSAGFANFKKILYDNEKNNSITNCSFINN